uniref:hypothetical protein n=1 Tax=Pedobacter schmidteae TaxID=2201271 RepID=UPI000EB02033|nr:hypothetical protein [Pedobacter schmidteae]
MSRILLVLAFITASIGVCFSQVVISDEKSSVTFPSPTAAALGKYGEYPVSLYSGQVNIDVPLLEINSGKLSLPISLSYNSMAKKPSEIPGWVGLGWSLNAGGVITRIVKNLPDDLYMYGYYHNSYTLNAQLAEPTPDPAYIEQACQRLHDLEPDIFIYNFAGYSGKFYFDNYGVPRVESGDQIKIEFTIGGVSHSTSSFFDSFTITLKDGVKFYFEQKEWSISHGNYTNSENHVSSWYLTKIENPFKDSITFKYTLPEEKYRFQESTYEKVVLISNLVNPGTENYAGLVTSQSMDEVIYLDEIAFNNGVVKFPKSKRNDYQFVPSVWPGNINPVAEEKKLENIVLYDNDNTAIKCWQFYYTENVIRLKLDSIRETSLAGQKNQAYIFSYNPVLLPTSSWSGYNPFNSNDVDHWGYYNGANNLSERIPSIYLSQYDQLIGGANRTPDPYFMKAEMLEKISFPTGGYSKFEFEPHDYSQQQSGPIEDEFEWIGPYSFFYESGVFETDPASIQFTLTEASAVQVRRTAINIGPNRQWLPSGSESSSYTLPAGTHSLASIFRTDELLNNGNSDVQTASGTIRIRRKKAIVNPDFRIAGGLRIKSIETFDGQNVVKKEYQYLQEFYNHSSGLLTGFPTYHRNLNDLWWGLLGYVISSQSIDEMPYGPSVVYDRVVEKLSDGSKIIHKYTGFVEYPDLDGLAYSPRELAIRHPISFNDLRGLEIGTEFYSQNGVKVKQIENEYNIHPDKQYHIPALDNKMIFSGRYGDGVWELRVLGTCLSKYTVPSRFVYKKSTKETLYDMAGGAPVVNQVNYAYENSQHFQVTKTTSINSKEESIQNNYSYPHEMVSSSRDPGGIYNGMINQNNIAPVIEEVQSKNSVQVSLLRRNFYQPFMGAYLPRTIEKQEKSTDPLNIFTVFHAYDSKGNLLSVSKENGPRISYLWSYGGQYPVAEINNADYLTIENILGASNITSFSNSSPNKAALDGFLNSLKTSLPNAQIASYVYKPLVGMTSQTDAKGMTTYYEYDSFQRLKCIKDQNGDVIKSYDYHYKPQTN